MFPSEISWKLPFFRYIHNRTPSYKNKETKKKKKKACLHALHSMLSIKTKTLCIYLFMSETLYELTFHSFVLLRICRRQTIELPFSFDGLKNPTTTTTKPTTTNKQSLRQVTSTVFSVYQKLFKCIRASLWCAHHSKVLLKVVAYKNNNNKNNNIKKKKKETKKWDKFTELFIAQ